MDKLLSVQNKSYERKTILVAKSVKGEEEIPDGTVAVLTPDMPDVLSHVSVRARNSKVVPSISLSLIVFGEQLNANVPLEMCLRVDRYALLHALIPVYWLISRPRRGSSCA